MNDGPTIDKAVAVPIIPVNWSRAAKRPECLLQEGGASPSCQVWSRARAARAAGRHRRRCGRRPVARAHRAGADGAGRWQFQKLQRGGVAGAVAATR